MHIEGWAFTKNEQEEGAARRARYLEIKHLHDEAITSAVPQYARCCYRGKVKPEWGLTHKDVLILCDRGNTCFGGVCEIASDGSFTADVYTD